MDIEKIQQELERRFKKTKSEFYQRRIIFWYDEEKEFVDFFFSDRTRYTRTPKYLIEKAK